MEVPAPPRDISLRNIIDKLAEFVARNGPEFEAITKQKQAGNPKFEFLYGGEYYNYYLHRVASEQAFLKQGSNQHNMMQQQQHAQLQQNLSITNSNTHLQQQAQQQLGYHPPEVGINPIHAAVTQQQQLQQHPQQQQLQQHPQQQQLQQLPQQQPLQQHPQQQLQQQQLQQHPQQQLQQHQKHQQQQQSHWTNGPNVNPSTNNISAQIEAINMQQIALREQIRQSEQNLTAQHTALRQHQQKQIDEEITKAENDKLQNHADENNIDLSEFNGILQPIIESCTKDSISAGKNWILQHTSDTAKCNVVLQYLLKKALLSGSTFTQKLHLIYLVNDVLHHCVRKNANDLKSSLENVVIPMFCSADIIASEEQRKKLTKLLSLWESKAKFFDACVISKLQSPESSMQEYKTNLMNIHNDLVTRCTQTTRGTLDNYQQQHQIFIQHATKQITTLETQKQTLEKQILSQVLPTQLTSLPPQQQQQQQSSGVTTNIGSHLSNNIQPITTNPQIHNNNGNNQMMLNNNSSNSNNLKDSNEFQQQQQPPPLMAQQLTLPPPTLDSSFGSFMESKQKLQQQYSSVQDKNINNVGDCNMGYNLYDDLNNSQQNNISGLYDCLNNSPNNITNQYLQPQQQQQLIHQQQQPQQQQQQSQQQIPILCGYPQTMMNINSNNNNLMGNSGDLYQSAQMQNFFIPDFSKPPPGFNSQFDCNIDPMQSGGIQISGQQNIIGQHTEEEITPNVPYYELPAGLMVPLIRLEDYNYKPLDPTDIRLPPPAPQNERLTSALAAFYAPPSHDRPRDVDGWEKLGLYEYYKVKNAAKKQKEEELKDEVRQKSKSPSPIYLEPQKPKRNSNKRCYKSKSRSKSRSKSPPQIRKSRSPIPPPIQQENKGRSRNNNRSRSPKKSPNIRQRERERERLERREQRERERENRSISPPSFFGANYAKPTEFIEETNKGHQMLMKMGWAGSGTGLGSKSQGIDSPISGGEVRDRKDMYKGVGVSLNDPFENFRKNKGAAFIHRMRSRAEEKS